MTRRIASWAVLAVLPGAACVTHGGGSSSTTGAPTSASASTASSTGSGGTGTSSGRSSSSGATGTSGASGTSSSGATGAASSSGGGSGCIAVAQPDFGTATFPSGSYQAVAVWVADINHDGLDDLAIASPVQAGGVLVFFSLGDGGFAPPETLIGPYADALAFGNFSPDAGPALAATLFNPALQDQNFLYVTPLFEDGTADTADPCYTPCAKTCTSSEEYWGPCDSDLIEQPFLVGFPVSGAPDAVLATTHGNTFIQVFEQYLEEPGSSGPDLASGYLFEEPAGDTAGLGAMALADLNGDGLLDLAVVGSNYAAGDTSGPTLSDDLIWVLLQTAPANPPWPSASASPYSTGTGSKPVALALGDLEGKGNQDIAVACYGSSVATRGIQILVNDGAGSYALGPLLATAAPPISVAVGDFNGDGHPDIAAVWEQAAGGGCGGLDIFLNEGCGAFAAAETTALSDPAPTFVASGRFHDGGIGDDLVVVDGQTSFAVLLNGP